MRFGNPDIVKYAESFGAKGYRASHVDELLPTLRAALDAGCSDLLPGGLLGEPAADRPSR
ncbi:thiamine pyrophosphate-dependent enzyme [Mycobacterium tilburgii]|uniref:thiamine pyrophosphate-dependent enzyme n=1 Tax=Mycobacterium tilburgii TaxID=44467 RepID=UPI0021B2A8CC